MEGEIEMDLNYLEEQRSNVRESLVTLENQALKIGTKRIELKAQLDDLNAAIRVWDRKFQDIED